MASMMNCRLRSTAKRSVGLRHFNRARSTVQDAQFEGRVPPTPVLFSNEERETAAGLIELALAEDLDVVGALPSEALIAPESRATFDLVSRADGIFAGGPL